MGDFFKTSKFAEEFLVLGSLGNVLFAGFGVGELIGFELVELVVLEIVVLELVVLEVVVLEVEEIGSGELRKAACCNLSESFETNASVDVNMTDAVSGAKKIQLEKGKKGTESPSPK